MAQFKKPARLKEALSQALQELGMADEITRWQLVKDFGKIAGEKIAQHAQAYKTGEGILYVLVDSPSWMNQLYLIKDEVVKKMNDAIGRNVVKDIRFSLKD